MRTLWKRATRFGAILAVLTGLSLAVGCLASRPCRDTVAGRSGPVPREDVAERIRAVLDDGEDAPPDRRHEVVRSGASRILGDIGTRGDAGHLLALGLSESEPGGDLALLEGRMKEALDALSFATVVEADIPEGWPEPSPPGLIRVKEYPAVRRARVTEDRVQGSLFRELFRHIGDRVIPMTAPVEMSIPGEPAEEFLSFLYASPESGPAGPAGNVEVVDDPAMIVLSVGIRGSHSDDSSREGLALLRDQLSRENAGWTVAGEPRVLACNSPFVPWFLEYGEVQIPVTR